MLGARTLLKFGTQACSCDRQRMDATMHRIIDQLQAECNFDKELRLNSENKTVFNACFTVRFGDPEAFSTAG